MINSLIGHRVQHQKFGLKGHVVMDWRMSLWPYIAHSVRVRYDDNSLQDVKLSDLDSLED